MNEIVFSEAHFQELQDSIRLIDVFFAGMEYGGNPPPEAVNSAMERCWVGVTRNGVARLAKTSLKRDTCGHAQ